VRTTLWLTAAFLVGGGLLLIAYLLRPKGDATFPSTLGLADVTGIVSLAVNAALFIVTIISLLIAVAAYRASEKSGEQQLQTLKQSREALQTTADTLKNSAQDFRDSAEAAKGQFTFLQTEKRDRDEAVLTVLYDELSSNEVAVTENRANIETELGILKQNQRLIGPINTLRTSAWELLRVYLPPQISGNAAVLSRVTSTYTLTDRTNEIIRSRENYRIANGAMNNFGASLTAYDQALQALNAQMSPSIKELLNMLKPMRKVEAQAAPRNPAN
jgi:membrane protein implicated in regulation of membrane protease activity